jgi:hypothetical protein
MIDKQIQFKCQEIIKGHPQPGVVVATYNPSTQEYEAGGF